MNPTGHPDQKRVQKLVESILSESKFSDWKVDMLDYDFYTSSYNVKLTLSGNSAPAKVPSEMIDEIWASNDVFKRRRVKKILKEAVKPFADLEL